MTGPASLFPWFRSTGSLRALLLMVVALSFVLNLAAGTFASVVLHAHAHDHVAEHRHHHDDDPDDTDQHSAIATRASAAASVNDNGGQMHEHAADIVLSVSEPLTWTFDRPDTRWLVPLQAWDITQKGYPEERPPRPA